MIFSMLHKNVPKGMLFFRNAKKPKKHLKHFNASMNLFWVVTGLQLYKALHQTPWFKKKKGGRLWHLTKPFLSNLLLLVHHRNTDHLKTYLPFLKTALWYLYMWNVSLQHSVPSAQLKHYVFAKNSAMNSVLHHCTC